MPLMVQGLLVISLVVAATLAVASPPNRGLEKKGEEEEKK